jgi:single-stranded-DNA-specific exonuclease
MSAEFRVERRALPAHFCVPAGESAVLARVHAARGGDARALRLQHLLPLDELGGLDAAAHALAQAMQARRTIVVVGDFDADGATGTALAVRGLRMLGAKEVAFRVPNRFAHGYGLSPALVDEIAASHAGCLLLTVDQGTSSVAGVARATHAGIDVIVSDHHLPGDELPNAIAIVNPNLRGDTFASKNLCGAGTVFYLLLALRAHLRGLGAFAASPEPALAELLDLVALGTVADLVPLDFNNRILVEQGLKRMRAGAACVGLRALLSVAGVDIKHVSAADLAFRIAPRLNAAGRMDDMALGIQCLLCDEPARARALAESLSQLNRERRELQDDMQQQALSLLKNRAIEPKNTAVLIVAEADFHQGIVGLVASKLVERFHRPAIAFAPSEEGWRGSARSIAGLHLRDALADIDTQMPGLMLRFGGHAMAAGLTLRADALGAFKRAAEQGFAARVNPEMLQQIVYTDGELARSEFSLTLAQQIRLGGPWGQQYPEPLFEIKAEILEAKRLAGRHLKLRLNWQNSVVSAIWFNTEHQFAALPCQATLLAQVSLEEYQGLYSPALFVRYLI